METEKEKMLQGRLYVAFDPQLAEERTSCRKLVAEYNATTADQEERRLQILGKLLGRIDKESPPFIEPPFTVDYGYNITIGKRVYMNFDCCILDCAAVDIGDRVLFGPKVQIYTPGHCIDPTIRNGMDGPEYAKPVKIGNDVWISGGVIIIGGVTIGDGATVCCGSRGDAGCTAQDLGGLGTLPEVIRHIKEGERSRHEIF
eukprot:jgi/Botrbrau1/6906/Bobra.67_3s0025.1